MRIFAPATPADLRRLSDDGPIVVAAAYAATPRLAAENPEADDEELAYAVMRAAADDCGDRARIVIAADAEAIETADAGVVHVSGEIALRHVASFHVGAQGGDELSWYAAQEVTDLVAQLGA